MQATIPIYRKGDKWYRTMTEVPDYEECRFVELYDDGIDFFKISLDKLVDLHLNHHWGKVATMGLREWCVNGERIPVSNWKHKVETLMVDTD